MRNCGFIGILCGFMLFQSDAAAFGQVSVREEKVTIPTWEIGPPAVHSLFPNPKGPIYPYTLNEILTDRKIDKVYNGVFLENEYIRVFVLPEIGGRIHGALDKTNQYTWLYWQKTVKPGLISMTGAWISGGIEWNFPHGHRPSGFMPVDHRIVRHEDGSATVWVGETEPVYRMRWLVGITAFPGRSYIRCDYIFVNPTDLKHPFQFWATAATHANEWSQAQYPGDMVTGHGKHEFWRWPIHNGVDLTWWKNSPNASSYFAFDNPSDWFGTYDHRVQGGMVHVADHRVMPGKKLWTWGSGPSGRIWEDILTEGGGPYFEPQAGAWSDNQPDYHWMGPQEVRTAHDYWYPVRDTRGYHNADKDFAVNTDLSGGRAFGAVYSTGIARDFRVVLRNARGNSVLSEKVVTISPDKPYTTEVQAARDLTVYDLRLEVYDSAGRLRIDVQRQAPKSVDLPEGMKDPGDPASMSQDELFHSGEWLAKFVRPEEAKLYFREALKRDPGDARTNAEMGIISLKSGKWKEALQFFDTALKRDPDNAAIHFGVGVARKGTGDHEGAYKAFHRAAFSADYRSAAHLNLARIDLRRGDPAAALKNAKEAESLNGEFADIPALKAAALRRAGRYAEALTTAERALSLDPMHFMGGYEKLLALEKSGREAEAWAKSWRSVMRSSVQNYLELAVAYADPGLNEEAAALLAEISEGKKDAALYPMVSYLAGWLKDLQGDSAAAAQLYARGSRGPVDYTNPHRLEEKAALESALRQNPRDARAHHYLGTLLYALGQREKGLEHWKEAVAIDAGLARAWRNVAYAENSLNKNYQAAYEAYRRAIDLDPKDARALLEFDETAERLEKAPAKRLTFLEERLETVNARDDLVARMVDLRLQAGGRENLTRAHESLATRHFHSWEGRYELHQAWVDVNRKLGDLALDARDYESAIRHYTQSGEYPKNLEVAARTPDFRAQVNWHLARVYLAMGRPEAADRFLRDILAEKYQKPNIGTYYQALAHKAMKNEAAARALLESLEKTALGYTSAGFENRGNRKTIGHYLLSLVLEERGERDRALQERGKALEQSERAERLAVRDAQIDLARAHQ